uniref:Nucleic acid binding protein n=1 Tax=Solanum tuberosum TaxID=4113 RepID=M1CKS6_SOLTU
MRRFLRQTDVLESHFHFLSSPSSSHLMQMKCQMEADKKQAQEKALGCQYVRGDQTYRQVHTCKSRNGYRMNRQLGPRITKQNEINFVWKSQVHNYLVHN